MRLTCSHLCQQTNPWSNRRLCTFVWQSKAELRNNLCHWSMWKRLSWAAHTPRALENLIRGYPAIVQHIQQLMPCEYTIKNIVVNSFTRDDCRYFSEPLKICKSQDYDVFVAYIQVYARKQCISAQWNIEKVSYDLKYDFRFLVRGRVVCLQTAGIRQLASFASFKRRIISSTCTSWPMFLTMSHPSSEELSPLHALLGRCS